jgi:hypothetical protein
MESPRSMNTTQQYPLSSLYGDYIRAAIGVLFFGMPLYFVKDSPILSTILTGILLVFIGFAAKIALRQLTIIETEEEGIIANGPLGRRIAWRDINKVALKFYSTRRDKNEGWMQLTLYSATEKMTLESSLDGFNDVADAVVQAGFRNNAEMDETTMENIASMGITINMAEEA